MNNPKVAVLLNKGIKFETLKMLNETQINMLYTSVVGEQNNLRNNIKGAKEELAGLVPVVNNLAAKIGEEEIEEDDEDLDNSVEKESDYDPYAGNSVGNDDGPSSDDGFNDKADDGMDEEVGEEFKSKSQQKYFFAKCEEEGPKSKWCKMADEFAGDTKNWKKLPKKVSESKIRQIEESLIHLVRKYIPETMTKKALLNILEQQPGTKEAPVKTPTRTKPERKTPYKPKHKPAPKAGDTQTAPKVKPGVAPSVPERKTPYKPKHKPAPKAKKELPSFLKFNTLNIKFRDEKEN
tara:strand:- start:2831 stop:3709 length:879 start_codon:yes stop_codon:yes gene_type:complete